MKKKRFLDNTNMKFDSGVSSIQIDDPFDLSDHSVIQFSVDYRLRAPKPNSVKRFFRKFSWDNALERATILE